MRLYRADALDTPTDPFVEGDGALRVGTDIGLAVADGLVVDRGPWAELRARHPEAPVDDLRGGLLLPGFVDTHVHYPQLGVIGGLGLPLLDWLDRRALPEEARFADQQYARAMAARFCAALVGAGTTSALVFGAHFAPAVDELFAAAERAGLRMTAGLVVGDRGLRPDLLTDPATALADGRALVQRWHGRGRLRYAVTPRFSLSCSDALLASCADLADTEPGVAVTSHVNENPAEIAQVRREFPAARHYVDSYDRHGLVGRRTVLAHDVHPQDAELAVLAERGATVAHCPTSNAALGSGLFPLRRHVEAGVRVALGSDVGAGTGPSLLKEGLQAVFTQQALGPGGYPLTPAHLLYLATRAGALALQRGDEVGDLSVGRQFDAVLVRPPAGSTTAAVLDHADDLPDAWGRLVTVATPADIDRVWIGGDEVAGRAEPRTDDAVPALIPG